MNEYPYIKFESLGGIKTGTIFFSENQSTLSYVSKNELLREIQRATENRSITLYDSVKLLKEVFSTKDLPDDFEEDRDTFSGLLDLVFRTEAQEFEELVLNTPNPYSKSTRLLNAETLYGKDTIGKKYVSSPFFHSKPFATKWEGINLVRNAALMDKIDEKEAEDCIMAIHASQLPEGNKTKGDRSNVN